MSRSININKTVKYVRASVLSLFCFGGVVGCAAVVPYIPLAVELGSNLLVAASGNYSGKYSELVGSAVNTLTGRPQAFDLEQGQSPDQVDYYAEPTQTAEQGYQDQPSAYQDTSEQAYQDQSYVNQDTSQQGYQDQSNVYQEYGDSAQGYSDQGLAAQAYQMQDSTSLAAVPGSAPIPFPSDAISLDVSILRKTATGDVASIEDGAVMRDGRDAMANQGEYSGDRFKIAFRANCNCFIYIISADATGRLTPIFPHVEDAYLNPVQVGMSVEIPRSQESSWYGLDQYRGVETLYFVASKMRRDDVEQVLEQLRSTANEEMNTLPSTYVPVTQPYLVTSAMVTRGLPASCAKINVERMSGCIANRGIIRLSGNDAQQYNFSSGGEMAVSVQPGQRAKITPETFMINQSGTDLVFTRWFLHE